MSNSDQRSRMILPQGSIDAGIAAISKLWDESDHVGADVEAEAVLRAALPFIIAELADEAFRDKKIQGLQRVLIGNWLRARS